MRTAQSAVAVAFGLTPAETRLLASLFTGRTLIETATTLDIIRPTAKTHLEHIFLKTGVTRQAERMRLWTGLDLPDGVEYVMLYSAIARLALRSTLRIILSKCGMSFSGRSKSARAKDRDGSDRTRSLLEGGFTQLVAATRGVQKSGLSAIGIGAFFARSRPS
jgi:DNA-binding CsgD family transcriptional regulator